MCELNSALINVPNKKRERLFLVVVTSEDTLKDDLKDERGFFGG